MAESISGGRPLTPVEAFQEQQKADQAEKIEQIGLSYDTNNSVSQRSAKEKEEALLAPVSIHAPDIPVPDQSATPTGDELIIMETQVKAQEASFNLTNGLEILKETQPNLVTPELTNQIGQITNRLNVIESAPAGLMADVSFLSDNILRRAANETLDADMLNQIMSEIQTKMDDNAVKFSEFEIKARSADAQQKYESNIQKIEEHIKEVEDAKARQSSSGGGFLNGLKAFFTAILPPLAIYEAVVAIHDEITGRDSGLSIFSRKNSINKTSQNTGSDASDAFTNNGNMAVNNGKPVNQASAPVDSSESWNSSGDAILKSIGIEPSTGKPLGEGLSKTSTATTPAQPASLEPAESYTLESEGSEQKVAASDVEISAAIQGLSISETALSHQEMMKLLQQMKAAEENQEKLEEAIAALESGDLESLKQAVQGLSGGEAIIELIDNPGTAGLTSSLLDVPAKTAQIQEDQATQNSLVSRHSGA